MLLYTHPLSANAHKVKLLLGYLGLVYDERDIDIPGGEQREAAFLAVSALGQIPVLEDGPVRLRDAQAILVYLGGRHGGAAWWPGEPLAQGQIAQWLAFATLELQTGINLARLHFRLGAPCDLVAAQAQGAKTLAFVEAHLSDGRLWLELDRPTIADCACAPFIARAGEAGHDLASFSATVAWIARLAALPGFTAMEGWA
jgi:glutathione S-transferase